MRQKSEWHQHCSELPKGACIAATSCDKFQWYFTFNSSLRAGPKQKHCRVLLSKSPSIVFSQLGRILLLFGHLFKFEFKLLCKMKLPDLSQNTGGQKVIILSNLLLRFGQLVTGVVTIILYSQENGYWLNKGLPGKIVSSRSHSHCWTKSWPRSSALLSTMNSQSELSLSSRQLPSASSPSCCLIGRSRSPHHGTWSCSFFILLRYKFSPFESKVKFEWLTWELQFGVMRDFFYHVANNNGVQTSDNSTKEYYSHFENHWKNMQNICWVDLAGMLLFLTSAVTGAMLIWMGHRSSRRGASIVWSGEIPAEKFDLLGLRKSLLKFPASGWQWELETWY